MRNVSFLRTMTAWIAAFIISFGLLQSGIAAPPSIPDSLKALPTETLVLTAHAKGVQIYECKPKKDNAAQFEWVLKAPEADLFDDAGKKIGRHYAGPTWESTDGSKVVGELKSREPSSNTSAIPWLLLSAKAHEGSGVFGPVQSIQRLETEGGKAPAGAPEASDVGKELRVPYTAVYYFYAAKP